MDASGSIAGAVARAQARGPSPSGGPRFTPGRAVITALGRSSRRSGSPSPSCWSSTYRRDHRVRLTLTCAHACTIALSHAHSPLHTHPHPHPFDQTLTHPHRLHRYPRSSQAVGHWVTGCVVDALVDAHAARRSPLLIPSGRAFIMCLYVVHNDLRAFFAFPPRERDT